jgi:poly(A) polymerase
VQPALHTDSRYKAALDVARTLREAGHQAYFAGGCVRDLLLGVNPKDYDVATSATPDEIVALFPRTSAWAPTSASFWSARSPAGPSEDQRIATEVATFRNDGAYSDGRRPDAVRFSTDAREDVLRRDFTINGMLLDPLAYEASRRRRLPPPRLRPWPRRPRRRHRPRHRRPGVRFAEDKLRMLRAVRFAARLNFQIDPVTAAAIRCHAANIHQVSAERVRDELTRILTEGGARRGFELLYDLGLLAEVLPEVVRLRGVAQPPEFHPEGDVWVHTMLLLEKLPAGEAAQHLPGARCCTTSASPPPSSRPTPMCPATASASTATSKLASASPK